MEEAFASHVFFHSAAHFSLFISKATPSHALKISGWIVPERRFPQRLYFLPHVKPLSNNLFFQTLHHYTEIEVRAAMKSSFCLQAPHFYHTTAQRICRSSHSKSPIPVFNRGFCSFLTKQLSNLALMIGTVLACGPIKLKLSSASTLLQFLVSLGGFISKHREINSMRTWQYSQDLNPDVCTCSSKT